MPRCLFPSAEDGDRVNVGAAIENHGRCEGGAECGELFGGKEGIGAAVRGEQCERPTGCGCL